MCTILPAHTQRENASWQSTCNSIGLYIGYLFGNMIFILFESASFSNDLRSYLGYGAQNYGIVSLQCRFSFHTIFMFCYFLLLFVEFIFYNIKLFS